MKDIGLFRFLTAVLAVPVLGAAFFSSCNGVLEPVVLGGDYDSSTDSDSDSASGTDSETEDTDSVPDECWVQDRMWEEVTLFGTCQAPESECSGGYLESYPQGNCPDGFHCCIGDDQCLEWEHSEDYEMYCADTTDDCPPPPTIYFEVGCPGTQVCCLGFTIGLL
jgi:hypothetical protein